MFAVDDNNINYLVDKEKDNALKYAKYHSNHEAYAVIREEFEESIEEIKEVEKYLNEIWINIRTDSQEDFDYNIEKVLDYTKETIKELLQVAGCCKKYLENKKD